MRVSLLLALLIFSFLTVPAPAGQQLCEALEVAGQLNLAAACWNDAVEQSNRVLDQMRRQEHQQLQDTIKESQRAADQRVRDSRRAADDAFNRARDRIDLERHDLDQWSLDRLQHRGSSFPPLPR